MILSSLHTACLTVDGPLSLPHRAKEVMQRY